MSWRNGPLKIMTLNVNGIKNPAKIQKLAQVLHSELKKYDVDLALLQEVAVDRFNIPGYAEEVNIGSSRRGTALLYKKSIPLQRQPLPEAYGERVILARVHDIVVVNVYAPSGSQARAKREKLFGDISSVLQSLLSETDRVLLAGDFNCVLSGRDKIGTGAVGSSALGETVRNLDLCDVWRYCYPMEPGFTFSQGRGSQASSRLDRIYVSYKWTASVPYPAVRKLELPPGSDHHPVLLSITFPPEPLPPSLEMCSSGISQHRTRRDQLPHDQAFCPQSSRAPSTTKRISEASASMDRNTGGVPRKRFRYHNDRTRYDNLISEPQNAPQISEPEGELADAALRALTDLFARFNYKREDLNARVFSWGEKGLLACPLHCGYEEWASWSDDLNTWSVVDFTKHVRLCTAQLLMEP